MGRVVRRDRVGEEIIWECVVFRGGLEVWRRDVKREPRV